MFCVILLFSIIIINVYWIIRRHHKNTLFYTFLTHCLIGIIIGRYVGFGKGGSPVLSPIENRRFEHVGYFIDSNHEAIFTSEPNDGGFPVPNFCARDTLKLKPVFCDDMRDKHIIKNWILSTNISDQPLRLNNICINVPTQQWVDNGYSFMICRNSNKLVVTFKICPGQSATDTCYLKPFTLDSTGLWYATQPKSAFAIPKIKEAWLIKDSVKYSGWDDIISSILLVRKQLGNTNSDLGYLISANAIQNDKLKIGLCDSIIFTMKNIRDTIPSGQILKYGYGNTNLFGWKLSKEFKINWYGNISANIWLTKPKSWPFPDEVKKPFLITSKIRQTQYNMFHIDLGHTQNPFYALGQWKDSQKYDTLIINTGEIKKPVTENENIFLGNGLEGAILQYTKVKGSINFAGIWGMGAIFLSYILVLIYFNIFYINSNKPLLEMNWLFLWVIFLTILTVRFIISYRVSLFPPSNANDGELRLFHDALIIGTTALYILPLLFFAIRFISSISEHTKHLYKETINKIGSFLKKPLNFINNKEWKYFLCIIFLSIPFVLLWPLLGSIWGDQQSFLGIRINLISSVLLFYYLAAVSKWINQDIDKDKEVYVYSSEKNGLLKYSLPRIWGPLIFFSIIIIATFTINIIMVEDSGFLIYLPIFLSGALMWTYWHLSAVKFWDKIKAKRILWYLLGWATIIIIIICIFLSQKILPQITNLAVDLDILNNQEANYARLVNYSDTEEQLLMGYPEKSEKTYDIKYIRRNMQQQWQMLNYAHHGSLIGHGYTKAPLSNVGMTYPTSLTDCLFSTLILSEFGFIGGIAILMIFGSVFLCCYFASRQLHEDDTHRSWIIFMLGSFWFITTMYMIAANVGAIPFTGQNIPLLALYSRGDLLQSGLLIILLGFLLHFNIDNDVNDLKIWKGLYPESNKLTKGYIFIVIICMIGLITKMFFITKDSDLGKDHDFTREWIQKIETKLDFIDPITGEIKPGTPQLSRLEEKLLEIYKTRSEDEKENPYSSFYYRLNGKMKVNPNFFTVSSPFNKPYTWKGKIIGQTRKKDIPVVSFLNKSIKIGLSDAITPFPVYISVDTFYTVTPNKVCIAERPYPASPTLCTLTRNDQGGSTCITIIKDRGNIYIDGKKMKTGATDTLDVNKVVLIKIGNKRYYLVYEGIQEEVLAYIGWKNGRVQRIYPEGDAFPMSYSLGEIADRDSIDDKVDINLSINLNSQREVQRIIREYAQQNVAYKVHKDAEQYKTKQLSFTLMDPFSGEIIALGAWPTFNPNYTKYLEQSLENLPPIFQDRLIRDPNLRVHSIGSIAKPLFYGALQTQMPSGYDLRELNVWHSSIVNEQEKKLNEKRVTEGKRPYKHPHQYLAGVDFGSVWGCDNDQYRGWINPEKYLVYSQNFYQMTIWVLGLTNPQEIYLPIKEDSVRNGNIPLTKIRFGENHIGYLDVITNSPYLVNRENDNRPFSNLDETRIFKALSSIYNVYSLNIPDSVELYWRRNAKYFLPARLTQCNNYFFKFSTPQPVIFNTNVPGDINYIKIFGRGGGDNRWNNINLAEAMSRLVTGYYVNASIAQNKTYNPDSFSIKIKELPNPLNINSKYRIDLLNMMEKVVTNGTAKAINRKYIKLPENYRLIAKTGTIKEKEVSYTRDSEMLMFAVGEWNGTGFTPGKTIVGFIYMEEAPNAYSESDKFDLGKPLIKHALQYLVNK